MLEILRGSAELMVMAGYLKPAEVPVGADNGPRGVARACLRFVSFYRANWSRVRGLSPVDKALLEEAAQLGATLLREVKPRGVGKGSARTEEARAASDDRDRMAVVVTRLYDYVERVGAWRWGRACEAQVPSMLSRDTSRGGADDEDVVEEEEEEATPTRRPPTRATPRGARTRRAAPTARRTTRRTTRSPPRRTPRTRPRRRRPPRASPA